MNPMKNIYDTKYRCNKCAIYILHAEAVRGKNGAARCPYCNKRVRTKLRCKTNAERIAKRKALEPTYDTPEDKEWERRARMQNA